MIVGKAGYQRDLPPNATAGRRAPFSTHTCVAVTHRPSSVMRAMVPMFLLDDWAALLLLHLQDDVTNSFKGLLELGVL